MEKDQRENVPNLRILKEAPKLRIIPLNDALIADLSSAIGATHNLDIFAVSDLKEITARQESVKWLMDNLERAKYFLRAEVSIQETMPALGQSFFNYQKVLKNHGTSFWQTTSNFLQMVQHHSENLPSRLKELFTEINNNGDAYYQKETALTSSMVADLRRIASLEGIMSFTVDASKWRNGKTDLVNLGELITKGVKNTKGVSDIFCFGTKLFGEALDKPAKTWTPSALVSLIPGTKRLSKFLNKKWYEQRLDLCRMYSTPKSVACDIADHLNKILQENSKVAFDVSSLVLTVSYKLNHEGMCVSIIDFDCTSETKSSSYKADEVIHPDFGEAADENAKEKFAKKLTYHRNSMARYKQAVNIDSYLVANILRSNVIEAPLTFKEFCLPYLHETRKKFSAEINEILVWQKSIEMGFNDIKFIAAILKKLDDTDLPTCIPEMIEDGNIVSTEGMHPIRINGARRASPFGPLFVNGQIVNLTGRNGSGKSTAMTSVLDLCIMAHVGLPVICSKAKISVKKQLLLSFLERGNNESTFKTKLLKEMEIITNIKKSDTADWGKVLVIVDELGSATTQGSVMPVVQPYVKWLKDNKISAVISTQIQELSKYVGDELNGINYIIDEYYEFLPGIGEGEPVAVAQEMGFFDVLQKTIQ